MNILYLLLLWVWGLLVQAPSPLARRLEHKLQVTAVNE